MEFEWDDDKAARNLQKHGVSFENARLIFLDSHRTDSPDPGEYGEIRWQTIGLVQANELTVIYTLRATKIRLISARKATRHERNVYWDDDEEFGPERTDGTDA